MQLWYTRCPLPTASSIAIERGLLETEFAPSGIAVQSLNASASMAVREAHYDHGQSGLFRQGGNIPPLWSRSRGADTVVVATNWIDEYQAIVALEGSGIERPSDLRGRRLGLPRRVNEAVDYWRAMCLRGFLVALELAGIAPDEVEIVDLPVDENQIAVGGASQRGTLWRGGARARRQSREALALIRGEVDAIYTAGAPGAQLSAFMSAHTVFDLGAATDAAARTNNQVPTVLTVDGALARERPEIVARYLAALMEASRWAAEHEPETLQIIAGDVAATPEWVSAAYGPEVHRRLDLDLDARSIQAVERQKRFLLEHGFIANDFVIADWIDPRPLAIALEMLHERRAG
jgi:ABC-type nitrate/sulfonate/bicarbonate transport system substrate-binding protein